MKIFINLATAFFAVMTVWLIYSAQFNPQDGRLQINNMRAAVSDYDKTNQQMRLENNELSTLISEIKQDPKRMEELARESFLMIKPGEVFVHPLTDE